MARRQPELEVRPVAQVTLTRVQENDGIFRINGWEGDPTVNSLKVKGAGARFHDRVGEDMTLLVREEASVWDFAANWPVVRNWLPEPTYQIAVEPVDWGDVQIGDKEWATLRDMMLAENTRVLNRQQPTAIERHLLEL